MFGHERGTFTGAHTRYAGKLRLAHRGTIFFDKIGDIGPNAQAKLLRALETREVLPLVARAVRSIDVLVATTNRDLVSMMLAGIFRPDLFYRRNVVRIEVPPLREGVAHAPDLLAHLVTLLSLGNPKRSGWAPLRSGNVIPGLCETSARPRGRARAILAPRGRLPPALERSGARTGCPREAQFSSRFQHIAAGVE